MPDDDRPLREQLDEAIDKIRRELEIIQSPSTIGGGSDDRTVVAELEAELQALISARADLGPNDS
jgi:esterase/lipase